MPQPAQLDHAVINVQFDMDRAEGAFGDLGFSLTPRGYHSLGTINHLMMLGTDYVELIGMPPETDKPRHDLIDAPNGINGLVFKTTNVDDVFAHLQTLGMAGDPPKSFTRPVQTSDGAEAVASFRVVFVRPGVFPGGRIFYCEHGTPELVWRPEWQSHANGAQAIPEIVVASTAHEQEAEDFARMLHSEVTGGGDSLGVALTDGGISVLTPVAYQARYGAVASSMAGRGSIFGALVFRTDDLDKIRGVVTNLATAIPMIDETNRVVIREPTFDSVLEFIE